MQRLQNEAARIISGISFEETNHHDLLRELNWMNVKQLISHDLAVAIFKLRNGLSPSQCTENLQTISDMNMDTRQDPWQVMIIFSRNLANLTVR